MNINDFFVDNSVMLSMIITIFGGMATALINFVVTRATIRNDTRRVGIDEKKAVVDIDIQQGKFLLELIQQGKDLTQRVEEENKRLNAIIDTLRCRIHDALTAIRKVLVDHRLEYEKQKTDCAFFVTMQRDIESILDKLQY